MKRRFAAAFMAVMMCVGMVQMPVKAEEVSGDAVEDGYPYITAIGLDPGKSSGMFYIDGGTVTLKNAEIDPDDSGRALYVNAGKFILDDAKLALSNDHGDAGPTGYVKSGAALEVKGGVIWSDAAGNDGLYLESGATAIVSGGSIGG